MDLRFSFTFGYFGQFFALAAFVGFIPAGREVYLALVGLLPQVGIAYLNYLLVLHPASFGRFLLWRLLLALSLRAARFI